MEEKENMMPKASGKRGNGDLDTDSGQKRNKAKRLGHDGSGHCSSRDRKCKKEVGLSRGKGINAAIATKTTAKKSTEVSLSQNEPLASNANILMKARKKTSKTKGAENVVTSASLDSRTANCSSVKKTKAKVSKTLSNSQSNLKHKDKKGVTKTNNTQTELKRIKSDIKVKIETDPCFSCKASIKNIKAEIKTEPVSPSRPLNKQNLSSSADEALMNQERNTQVDHHESSVRQDSCPSENDVGQKLSSNETLKSVSRSEEGEKEKRENERDPLISDSPSAQCEENEVNTANEGPTNQEGSKQVDLHESSIRQDSFPSENDVGQKLSSNQALKSISRSGTGEHVKGENQRHSLISDSTSAQCEENEVNTADEGLTNQEGNTQDEIDESCIRQDSFPSENDVGRKLSSNQELKNISRLEKGDKEKGENKRDPLINNSSSAHYEEPEVIQKGKTQVVLDKSPIRQELLSSENEIDHQMSSNQGKKIAGSENGENEKFRLITDSLTAHNERNEISSAAGSLKNREGNTPVDLDESISRENLLLSEDYVDQQLSSIQEKSKSRAEKCENEKYDFSDSSSALDDQNIIWFDDVGLTNREENMQVDLDASSVRQDASSNQEKTISKSENDENKKYRLISQSNYELLLFIIKLLRSRITNEDILKVQIDELITTFEKLPYFSANNQHPISGQKLPSRGESTAHGNTDAPEGTKAGYDIESKLKKLRFELSSGSSLKSATSPDENKKLDDTHNKRSAQSSLKASVETSRILPDTNTEEPGFVKVSGETFETISDTNTHAPGIVEETTRMLLDTNTDKSSTVQTSRETSRVQSDKSTEELGIEEPSEDNSRMNSDANREEPGTGSEETTGLQSDVSGIVEASGETYKMRTDTNRDGPGLVKASEETFEISEQGIFNADSERETVAQEDWSANYEYNSCSESSPSTSNQNVDEGETEQLSNSGASSVTPIDQKRKSDDKNACFDSAKRLRFFPDDTSFGGRSNRSEGYNEGLYCSNVTPGRHYIHQLLETHWVMSRQLKTCIVNNSREHFQNSVPPLFSTDWNDGSNFASRPLMDLLERDLIVWVRKVSASFFPSIQTINTMTGREFVEFMTSHARNIMASDLPKEQQIDNFHIITCSELARRRYNCALLLPEGDIKWPTFDALYVFFQGNVHILTSYAMCGYLLCGNQSYLCQSDMEVLHYCERYLFQNAEECRKMAEYNSGLIKYISAETNKLLLMIGNVRQCTN